MPPYDERRATPARAKTYVPSVDPVELDELREDFERFGRELRLIKRNIAWNRVIDEAIVVCRLLAKVEAQEDRRIIGQRWPSLRATADRAADGRIRT